MASLIMMPILRFDERGIAMGKRGKKMIFCIPSFVPYLIAIMIF